MLKTAFGMQYRVDVEALMFLNQKEGAKIFKQAYVVLKQDIRRTKDKVQNW